MVGNSLEQEIIGLYNADTTAAFSINQIAHFLNKKYPYINKKVNTLIQEGILKKSVIGRSHLCTINLESQEAICLLGLNDAKKKNILFKNNKSIAGFMSCLTEKIPAYKTIVYDGRQVILVVENISGITRTAAKKRGNTPSVILSEESFLSYLSEQAGRERVVLYSCEKYYECLKKIQGKLRLQRLNLV